MSRAKPIKLPWGEVKWFDRTKDHLIAPGWQIELLALIENKDLDDLLDESLTRGDIYLRLYTALHGNPVPAEVLERRDRWRSSRQKQPNCRLCGRQGDSTKHHFVNKWILRELSRYSSKWSDRNKNTIPVCIDCHRDLHSRDGGEKSIAHVLISEEKKFVDDALQALADERPKLLILIARGNDDVYESRLVKDWISGRYVESACDSDVADEPRAEAI